MDPQKGTPNAGNPTHDCLSEHAWAAVCNVLAEGIAMHEADM